MRKIETYKARLVTCPVTIKITKENVKIVFSDNSTKDMIYITECYGGAKAAVITKKQWSKMRKINKMWKV